MQFKVKEVDTKGLQSKFAQANEAALCALAKNARADCQPYIPYETGALRRSGKEIIQNGTAYIEWGGDAKTSQYARVQYYKTLNHATPGNAANALQATDHWVEHARAVRGSAWEKLYAKVLGEKLGK